MKREEIKQWIIWIANAANWLLDCWNSFPSLPTWKKSERDNEKEPG